MKPEAQRIAIAEACGWTEISTRCLWGLPLGAEDDGTEACLKHLPEYPNSHDAMHAAILTLTPEQIERMWAVLTSDVIGWGSYEKDWVVLKATSQQLAEAFLKTIKRWEP